MSLISELNQKKYKDYDLGKKKLKLNTEIAEALDFVVKNGFTIDEVVELALEKLPIKRLVKEIEESKKERDNSQHAGVNKIETTNNF